MALLFCDGFDSNDIDLKWVRSGGSIVSTTRFSAGLCYATSGGNIYKMLTPSSKMIAGFALKVSSASGGYFAFFSSDAGTVYHVYLGLVVSGVIGLYKWGTSAPLATAVLTQSTGWIYVEFSATIDSVSGAAQVRVNGLLVIDYTGNTRNASTSALIDQFKVGWSDYAFDDIYICDGTGTVNNTFLGDVRIQTLLPTGAGTSTQLTPTGGANYTNANDTPDVTTSYNSSVTVGQRDTYAMGDLLASTGTILGVQENIHGWKSDAGNGVLKPAVLDSSTVYYGATANLGTSNAWYGSMQQVSPATGTSWTVSEVNGLEFGAEVA